MGQNVGDVHDLCNAKWEGRGFALVLHQGIKVRANRPCGGRRGSNIIRFGHRYGP